MPPSSANRPQRGLSKEGRRLPSMANWARASPPPERTAEVAALVRSCGRGREVCGVVGKRKEKTRATLLPATHTHTLFLSTHRLSRQQPHVRGPQVGQAKPAAAAPCAAGATATAAATAAATFAAIGGAAATTTAGGGGGDVAAGCGSGEGRRGGVRLVSRRFYVWDRPVFQPRCTHASIFHTSIPPFQPARWRSTRSGDPRTPHSGSVGRAADGTARAAARARWRAGRMVCEG